jgi:hypothetical protein
MYANVWRLPFRGRDVALIMEREREGFCDFRPRMNLNFHPNIGFIVITCAMYLMRLPCMDFELILWTRAKLMIDLLAYYFRMYYYNWTYH